MRVKKLAPPSEDGAIAMSPVAAIETSAVRTPGAHAAAPIGTTASREARTSKVRTPIGFRLR